jgi:hypothetical protein
MDFVVLGTGDAFSASRFGSSAVVIAPEGHVMIDAPDAVMRALALGATRSGQRIGPCVATRASARSRTPRGRCSGRRGCA